MAGKALLKRIPVAQSAHSTRRLTPQARFESTSAAVDGFMAMARASATLKAYAGDLKHFRANGGKIPATPQMVAMVQLIANPRQFDGKRVLVAGFLTMGFENTALWLNKEDANVGISKNAVFVGSPSSVVCPAGTYVQVRGVFDAKFTGHLGAFAGYLKIERCDQLMRVILPLN